MNANTNPTSPLRKTIERLEALDYSKEIRDRFWAKVDIRNPDDCWEWKGYCKKPTDSSRLPYGRFSIMGKQWGAHRFAYVLSKGEIGIGLCVCHACDNPKCCNPSHLWVGTREENNKDMHAKGRYIIKRDNLNKNQVHGVQLHCAKLNESLVRMIRSSNKSSHKLARELGVGSTAILDVRKRHTWKHVV